MIDSERGKMLDRARGCLVGLAVGEALGYPAENLTPEQIRNRYGRLTDFVLGVTNPFIGTESAIFTALLLAKHGRTLTSAKVSAAWSSHIGQNAGREQADPWPEEQTNGRPEHHAWSDGLALRAAPYGIYAAGRPGEAARLIAVDGLVSHEGEGVYGAQAVAAGVAAAMSGASRQDTVELALAAIPETCWSARSLRRVVKAASSSGHVEDRVRAAVVLDAYPWTDLAPEVVALAFGAYLVANGRFSAAILTAANMGRDARAIAAIAGALAGAHMGLSAVPQDWLDHLQPMRGAHVPEVAGRRVMEIADLLVDAASQEQTWAG